MTKIHKNKTLKNKASLPDRLSGKLDKAEERIRKQELRKLLRLKTRNTG